MRRVSVKIGDVFSVRLQNNELKFFQYIAVDKNQLDSEVIRAFKHAYLIVETPDMLTIIKDEVDFHAHVMLKLGVKLGYWNKVGNCNIKGDLSEVMFRDTNDYGKPEIKISQRWWVWKIGGQPKYIGKLKNKNKQAEIGIIVTPPDIIERMQVGKYSFIYPDYE